MLGRVTENNNNENRESDCCVLDKDIIFWVLPVSIRAESISKLRGRLSQSQLTLGEKGGLYTGEVTKLSYYLFIHCCLDK